MPAKKLGILARIYRNTSGNYASPTWTAMNGFSDAALRAAWDKADFSSRESRVKGGVKTQLDLGFTGKYKVSNTDANYLALWGASFDDSVLDLLILNGPIEDEGVRGVRYDAQIYSAGEDQGLGVALYDEFTIDPYIFDNEPCIAVVGAGGGASSVVYTDL